MMNVQKRYYKIIMMVALSGTAGCQQYNPQEIPIAKLSQPPLTATQNEDGKWVANSPSCPALKNHDVDEFYKKELGCANQYNLSKMIADPEDLISPESDNTELAQPLIEPYNQYKQNKLTPLKPTSTTGNAFNTGSY